MACVKYIKLNGKVVKVEGDSRVDVRRQITTYLNEKVSDQKITNFQFYQLKTLLAETMAEVMNKEISKRGLTQDVQISKLFKELFFNPKSEENYLTTSELGEKSIEKLLEDAKKKLSKENFNQVKELVKSFKDVSIYKVEEILSKRFKTSLSAGRPGVYSLLTEKFHELGPNTKTNQRLLGNMFEMLSMTDVQEDGKRNTVFDNPMVRDIFTLLSTKGYYVTLDAVQENKEDSNTDEDVVQSWQKEFHNFSSYNNLSEKLKSILNTLVRSKVVKKGKKYEVVPVKNFINMKSTYPFGYVYSHLITLLAGSGSSDIMMETIQEQIGKDPIITQLFPGEITSNENQEKLGLIWDKIASNHNYNFLNVIVDEVSEMIGGQVQSSTVMSVNSANFGNAGASKYNEMLLRGRQGRLILSDKYDTKESNKFTDEVFNLDERASEDDQIEELKSILVKYGFLLETDKILVPLKEFHDAAKLLANDVSLKRDVFSIENGAMRSPSLLNIAFLLSKDSKLNNTHNNSNGQTVYELNKSNAATRQIKRIEKDKVDYSKDPLFTGNKVLEAIKNSKVGYAVSNGLQKFGSKYLTAYDKMIEQDLMANQIISFLKGNVVELPIQADSSSMSVLQYEDNMVRKGKMKKGNYRPNKELIQDLVQLLKNEIASDKTSVTSKRNRGLVYFAEFNDIYKSGELEILNDEGLAEKITELMNTRYEDYRAYMRKVGMFEQVESKDGKRIKDEPLYESLFTVEEKDYYDFFYNYSYLYPSAAAIFNSHPNFYGKDSLNATLVQNDKRNKQNWSPSTPLRVGATWASKLFGKESRLTVAKTYMLKIFSEIEGTTEEFQKQIRELAKNNPADYANIVSDFERSTETDGQSFIDLFRLKAIDVSFGRWSDVKQKMYENLLAGNINLLADTNLSDKEREDLFNNPDAFITSIKGFHFSMRNINGIMQPFQKKDSEMVLIPAYGIKFMNGKPNSHYNAFYRHMLEQMGYKFSDVGVTLIPNFEEARSANVGNKFTDVFTFDSAIKTGEPTGQDIGQGTVVDVTQETTFEAMSVSRKRYINGSEQSKLEEEFDSFDSINDMPLNVRADFYEYVGIRNQDGSVVTIKQIQNNIEEFKQDAEISLVEFKKEYAAKKERRIPTRVFNKMLLDIFKKGDLSQSDLDFMVDEKLEKEGKDPKAMTSTERDAVAKVIVENYVESLINDKDLPYDLVGNYLDIFSHTPIVIEAIKEYGSKEDLIKDIVSQAKEQKGQANNWWKRFVRFVLNTLSKQGYRQVLTDAFLENKNLNGLLYSDSKIAPIDSTQKNNPSIMEVVNTLIESSTYLPFSNSEFYLRGKQEYLRVSNAISNFTVSKDAINLNAALKVGSEIDRFVRDFMNGEVEYLDSYRIGNNELMINLIGQLTELKEEFTKRGETVIAHEVTLHDDKLKIAGTTDIITYSQDGTFNVYDIKTMKGNASDIRDKKFIGTHPQSSSNKGKNSYDFPYNKDDLSKRIKHQKQINSYAMMLKNTYGINVNNMAVIPIVVNYSPEGILEGKPEQVKYAQLLDLIPVKPLEEVVMVDGRKMEYGNNTTVFSKNDVSVGIELPNEDYGVQQDTPVSLPGIKKEFSKQTAKNGKTNVNPSGKYNVRNLGRISGKKVLSLINDIEIKMITLAYQKAVKKLGNVEGVVRMVKAEILKRGLSSNYLEALDIITNSDGESQTNLPLNFPAFSFKIKQILNSVFTKQVGKNKMLNGVSLINASSVGFNEENRPKIIIKDGKIDYIEAIIPIHDKRLIKYFKLNEFMGKKEVEQLVKENPELSEIFEGIIWRTPNESKYSTVPIKVTGFMATEVASLVMLPVEISTMAGIDFDIDKMFGFMYAFRNRIDKALGLESLKRILKSKSFIKKLKDRGFTIESYLDKLIKDSQIEEKTTKEETIVEMYNQGLLTGPIMYFLDRNSNGFTVPRDESQEGLQNQLIDLYKGIFNSEDATMEMTTPSSNFVNEFQPYVDDLYGKIKDEVYSSPHRNAKARRTALDGKSLVGPFANINSIINYLQQAKKLVLQYNSEKGPIKLSFKFNGKPFDNFTNMRMSSGKYKFRSQQIALWVAAIVDNAKHPFAGYLNINWSTIDMFMTGLLAGVELKTMIYFVNNPIVKSYSYFYKAKGNSKNATNAAVAATIDAITGRQKLKEGSEERKEEDARINKILGRAYDFSDAELRVMAKGSSKDMSKTKQLQILGSLLQYNRYGEEMRKLVFMLKGSENGVGSSDGDTIAHFLKLEEANNFKYLEGAKEMLEDTTQPYYYLNALITGENKSKKIFSTPSSKGNKLFDTKSITSSMATLMQYLNIPNYSTGIFIKLIRELNEEKKKIAGETLTAQDINLLLRDFTTYNFIKVINPNGTDFLETFPDYFENKVGEHYEKYSELLDKFFTQKVQKVKGEMSGVFYVKSNNEISEENRYMEDLMRTLYLEDKKFVQELAKYAVYKDGLGVSAFGFTSLIPVEAFKDVGIDKNFNNYELSLSNFNEATTDDVQIYMADFLEQFLLNNPKQLSFIAKDTSISRKKKKQKYLYNELTNEVRTLIDGVYIPQKARGLLFKRDRENMVGGTHFKMYNPASNNLFKVSEKVTDKTILQTAADVNPSDVEGTQLPEC